MSTYTFEPIGVIRSCFKEKFGIPRQPGLVSEAMATLEITPAFCRMEAFRRLEDFSHIWILFVFHRTIHQGWKPTVRPPRLGGNARVGVFASRSGFRPNAIGQSAVELLAVESVKDRIRLVIGGVDLLDGTPVLDIKPYLPYTDAIPGAISGYAPQQPEERWPVVFAEEAERSCRKAQEHQYPELRNLISKLLSLDPRPGYRDRASPRSYGMRLWDLNITFRFLEKTIEVTAIQPIAKGDAEVTAKGTPSGCDK